MKTIYEKGAIRKLQYAQNDAGAWFGRSTGGKRQSPRWTRCCAGWTPDLAEFTSRQEELPLPSGE